MYPITLTQLSGLPVYTVTAATCRGGFMNLGPGNVATTCIRRHSPILGKSGKDYLNFKGFIIIMEYTVIIISW